MDEKNNQTQQPTTEPVVDPSAQEPIAEPVVEKPIEKTFTQSELDSIIEKRLAKERKKMQDEIDEAARLAQMTEAERQQALFDKRVKEFEERERQFEEAQASLNKEKMLNETRKQLAAKNLPMDFADRLTAATAEDTLNNINAFEKQWQDALGQAVDSRIKSTGSTPTSPVNKKPAKDPKAMSFKEFSEYMKNKED